MPEGVCGYDGKTYIVGLRCEVTSRCDCCGSSLICDKPTTHFYPAMGGGTMPLCSEHAQKHLPHGAWPIKADATFVSQRSASQEKPE